MRQKSIRVDQGTEEYDNYTGSDGLDVQIGTRGDLEIVGKRKTNRRHLPTDDA